MFRGIRLARIHRLAVRTKVVLGTALMFLAVLGIFTFPLFILEEGSQIALWGTWQAEKSDMIILKEGIDVVENINRTMKTINTCGGWLHPLSFLSYRGYCKALDYWIRASKAKVLANDPKLMDGETVTLQFHPKNIEITQAGAVMKNGQVIVIMPEAPTSEIVILTAKARWIDNNLVLDTR